MSLNITGKARVYQFKKQTGKNGKEFATASLQVGKKKQDGTWDNMWFNAKFVKTVPAEIEKGETINIVSGMLESNKTDKGTFTNVIIFEYAQDGYEPKDELKSTDYELPF